MTLAILKSRALAGMQAPEVTVEVHLANGLPSFTIVGLPDTEVKESKDRVRAALQNGGFEFPARRITVNLAPADLPKESGRFDLPIALGILAASGQMPDAELANYEFAGELSLTGDLRAVRGALAMTFAMYKGRARSAASGQSTNARAEGGAENRANKPTDELNDTLLRTDAVTAAETGIETSTETHIETHAENPTAAHTETFTTARTFGFILPRANADEAALVADAAIFPADSLLQVFSHFAARGADARLVRHRVALPGTVSVSSGAAFQASQADFSDVKGQGQVKRALEVAAAGGHSVLMVGPPGTGKSMLAARFSGILPPMSENEALESAAVQSLTSGFDAARWKVRPYRAPHHTASGVALVGGGNTPRPGEISLAHCGVLFLVIGIQQNL